MDDLRKQHILITGAGAPGAAGIINALRSLENCTIFTCDVRNNVPGQILGDHFFNVLPGTSGGYVSDLLEKCISRKIKTILPITTNELFPLSRNKELFSRNGISVIVSSADAIEIVNNKGMLYRHLEKEGIAVPEYRVAQNKQEIDLAFQYFEARQLPFTFKPCVSNGSRGFRIIDNQFDEWDALLNQKPTNANISLSKAKDLFNPRDQIPPFLFSEFLPGDEYSVDCLVYREKHLIIPRKRIRINNGISVEGLITENAEVISYCDKILRSIQLEGPIGIQVRYSAKNEPLLLEINPRLQGTSVACRGAGVNLPALAVNTALGSQADVDEIKSGIKWNTHFIRYYEEVYLP